MAFGIDDIGIMVGSQLLGSMIQSDSAKSAANTQASATDRAVAAQTAGTNAGINENARQYNTTRADLAPYRDSGSATLRKLMAMLGVKPPASLSTSTATQEQIQGLYQNYLGRAPSQQEINWQLSSGKSPYEIESGMASNPEFQSRGVAAPAPMYQPPAQEPDVTQSPEFGSLVKPFDRAAYGNDAVTSLANEQGLNRKFTLDDFWQDPVTKASYQSGLDLGTKALRNAAPLTTGMDSGAALKELEKFGSDYTGGQAAGSQARFVNDQTRGYGKLIDAYGRDTTDKSNIFTRLMAMVGGGQTATQTTAGAGANAAGANAGLLASGGTNTAGLISAGGNAQAAAGIAGGNAFSGALSSIGNWWNQNQMIDRLTNGGGALSGVKNWFQNTGGFSPSYGNVG